MTPAHDAAVHLARDIGSRPAASAAELRAHRYVERRFEAAGLETSYVRFTVPGRGRSRDVVGVHRGAGRCLKVVMAHADSVADGPGANDNASGVGILVALAGRLPALRTPCDVWLVATGAEERPYTGAADHLGALALVAPPAPPRPGRAPALRAVARHGRPRPPLPPPLAPRRAAAGDRAASVLAARRAGGA